MVFHLLGLFKVFFKPIENTSFARDATGLADVGECFSVDDVNIPPLFFKVKIVWHFCQPCEASQGSTGGLA